MSVYDVGRYKLYGISKYIFTNKPKLAIKSNGPMDSNLLWDSIIHKIQSRQSNIIHPLNHTALFKNIQMFFIIILYILCLADDPITLTFRQCVDICHWNQAFRRVICYWLSKRLYDALNKHNFENNWRSLSWQQNCIFQDLFATLSDYTIGSSQFFIWVIFVLVKAYQYSICHNIFLIIALLQCKLIKYLCGVNNNIQNLFLVCVYQITNFHTSITVFF